MSEIINNIISIFIQISTLFIFMKILFNINVKIHKTKNILSFIGFNIFTMIVYSANYTGLHTIIYFLTIVCVLSLVYKKEITTSFLAAGIFMIVTFFADIITSSIFVNFASIEELRGKYFIYSNLCVSLITIIIIFINPVKKYFVEIIRMNSQKANIKTIIFIILSIVAISIVFLMTSKNYILNETFLLSIIGIILFIILVIIFFIEKYEKEMIINKYDQLFEYIKTFEYWMDTENMNIHESKNQLATLREMVKNNEKATNFIDNIIKERINFGGRNKEKLKYIPKGGLKGLLYYKITIAENKNINICIDISPNAEASLKTLTLEENKILCRLMGIFLDNAIEASSESKKKIISCEVYNGNDSLNIAISNTFIGEIEVNKLTKNGYTTKGENRGKGLYLANKFSSRYKRFKLENRIINEFYIQKIIIKRTDY